MKKIFEELGLDYSAYTKIERTHKRMVEGVKCSIKKGSGKSPDDLKIFNKYVKYRGYTSVSVREYAENSNMQDLVKKKMYEIDCTIFFCSDIFGINIDRYEASNISSLDFQKYHEGDMDSVSNECLQLIRFFPQMKIAARQMYVFSDTKLKNTKEILKSLDIESFNELKILMYFQKKYGRNQKKKAIEEFIIGVYPQINDKFILNQISSKALQ